MKNSNVLNVYWKTKNFRGNLTFYLLKSVQNINNMKLDTFVPLGRSQPGPTSNRTKVPTIVLT